MDEEQKLREKREREMRECKEVREHGQDEKWRN